MIKWKQHFLLLLLFWASNIVYGQMEIKLNTSSQPNYEFYIENSQGLQPIDSTVIAGVTSLSYSYLWIFSDGTFSVEPSSHITHTFEQAGTYKSHVYSVEIYDNGPPPPDYAEKDGIVISNTSNAKLGQNNTQVASNQFLDLDWFEHGLCFKDSLRIGLISTQKPVSLSGNTVKGVLKMFYNGEILVNNSTVSGVSTIDHSKTINYGAASGESYGAGVTNIMGHTYKDSLVWNVVLADDEKHFFLEFKTDEVLQDFVSTEGKVYTTPYLVTFESDNPLLQSNRTSRAIGYGLPNHVIDAEEVSAKIVGDHDPNTLTIHSERTPEADGSYLMEGLVSFTNDAIGKSIVKYVDVSIDLPDTYDDLQWSVLDHSENLEDIEFDGKGHWVINRATITAVDDTLRKAFHMGWLKFRLKSKPHVAFDDLKPVSACITFGTHRPQCTEDVFPVKPISELKNEEVATFLDAQADDNGGFCHRGKNKWCYILMGLLIFFVLFGLIKKM